MQKNNTYWKSLGQLQNSPDYERFLHNEFPEQMSESLDPISRRRFMGLMGASAALAGLAACHKPVEKIVPYVKPPEELVPGMAEYYATTMPFGLSPVGVLVKSVDGRPIKIEGNALHPASLGGTNAFIQAEILNLYDPDRSQHVMFKGVKSSRDEFLNAWSGLYNKFSAARGEGLALLSPSLASPTLSRLATQLERDMPRAKWYVWDAVSDMARTNAAKTLFGKSLLPVYDLNKADVVLTLDADILMMDPDNVANTRAFANRRSLVNKSDSLGRLYAVESYHTLTGSNADHHLPVKASQIGPFVIALAQALQELGVTIDAELPDEHTEFDEKFIHALARDLSTHKGRCLVTAGQQQPGPVHVLVYAVNAALGNIGKTLDFYNTTDRILADNNDVMNLKKDCDAKKVDTLVMLGGNPAFDAPADLDFLDSLKNIPHSIHLSLYEDETSQFAEWHVPQTHFLESWGDAVDARGCRSVVQPLIMPLYDGHSEAQLLNLVVTGRNDNSYDIVRETWKTILPQSGFEKQWDKVLHDGVYVHKTAPQAVSVNSRAIRSAIKAIPRAGAQNIELLFLPSPSVYDGRFANNGWLQELPHPMSKVAWNNPLEMGPALAESLGVDNGDLVQVECNGISVELPVWVLPGMAANTAAVTLGYGRKTTGRISKNVGTDVYPLRHSANLYTAGTQITKTGKSVSLANTQDHGSMEGRPIVREADLKEYHENPEFAHHAVEHPPLENMWQDHDYSTGYQWGMIIDLNKCTGCNTCVAACQSENNIPIVGMQQVRNGREMHWIRLDRYFKGATDNPRVVHQPMTCQHCENAPCEQVCPVAATVHDSEGLNLMTYNRCVGTRYCSNNCPYKVRRFNFFNYHKNMQEQDKLLQNPDVTVRSRGVMEKCSFCLQRINAAKSKAKKQGRELHPNEVKTACQQACPANAITFGNILDEESDVAKLKQHPRAYAVLGELNNRPRVLYLAKVRNPNPDLAGPEEHSEHHA